MNKSILIRVAQMYYEKNKTQQEIANEMGCSRMAVSRLLQKAQQEGIVEIKINYEHGYTELEEEIKEKYKVKEVIITPIGSGNGLKKLLAEATASLLLRILKDNDIVGVGWGSTLTHIPQYLDEAPNLNITFVPLLGGYGQADLEMHANIIASNLGRAFGGKSHSLLAPAIVENIELKNALLSDSSINSILELGRRANIALIGIGAPFNDGSTLLQSGYFKEENIYELRKYGAECDIVSCIYLNKEGKECGVEYIDRIIGISGEDFKKIPLVIGVSGGAGKHLAIKLALKANVLDIIVTDEETGIYLLEE